MVGPCDRPPRGAERSERIDTKVSTTEATAAETAAKTEKWQQAVSILAGGVRHQPLIVDQAIKSLNYHFRRTMAERLKAAGIPASGKKWHRDLAYRDKCGRSCLSRVVEYDAACGVLRFRIDHNFWFVRRPAIGYVNYEAAQDHEITFHASEYSQLLDWLPNFILLAAGYRDSAPPPPCGLSLDQCIGGYCWTAKAEKIYQKHIKQRERRLARQQLRQLRGGAQ